MRRRIARFSGTAALGILTFLGTRAAGDLQAGALDLPFGQRAELRPVVTLVPQPEPSAPQPEPN